MKIIHTNYRFLLLLVILVTFCLRTYNLNWDANQHLHPDERFLTMVGNALKTPQKIGDYFDPKLSTMNPYNLGYGFFVYGSFSLYLTKLLSIMLNMDTYNQLTILGRFLSALFDTGTVLVTYYIGMLISTKFNRRKIPQSSDFLFGLLAAVFMCFNVLSIQQSHFFTVDTFLTFFITASVFTLLKGFYADRNKATVYFFLTALFFGLAMACKIIALFFLPFFLLFFLLSQFRNTKITKQTLLKIFSPFLSLLIVSYCVFRIIQPFYFADNNFFNPKFNAVAITNFKQLAAMDNSSTTFPPAVQWQSKSSIIWPLSQLFLYGLNPIVTILTIVGIGTMLFYSSKKGIAFLIKRSDASIYRFIDQYAGLLFFAFYSIAFFIYQGTRFTMNMRYFYMTYPMFIILAVFALTQVIRNKLLMRCLLTLGVIISIGWSLAYVSMYERPHSRVAASEWMYSHIPPGSRLIIEHWDDGLPLALLNKSPSIYSFEELPVYDGETLEKWEIIYSRLAKSDYYILSSNRAWGSIPSYPKRYPKTAIFYNKLFSGELGLVKIAQFTSRPKIGFVEINDDDAEENFTVFDHPKVIIFKIVDRKKLAAVIDSFKN